jgi:phospholipase D1/2
MLEAILSATESIYISDWFFSAEVYLKRNPSGQLDPAFRLDNILKAKAEAGVLICILVWNETKVAMPLNSEYVQNKMQGLTKNSKIFVQRHPLSFPVKWSHHQKIVVVDQDIAFVGGLDLCFGRYDDPHHYITDPDGKIWPGKDYYNPVVSGLDNLHRFAEDMFDRKRHPRMGYVPAQNSTHDFHVLTYLFSYSWHDIHVRVGGMAARDVSRNFIERWNFAKEDLERISTPYLVPKISLPAAPESGSLRCQVLRSLGDWHLRNFSGSEVVPEKSIYKAYLSLIGSFPIQISN